MLMAAGAWVAKRLKKYDESGMSKLELGSCQGTDLIEGKHNAVRKDWRRRYKCLVCRRKRRERTGQYKESPDAAERVMPRYDEFAIAMHVQG